LRGYLGLGSNLGDRLANLRAARAALGDRGMKVVASSSVFETAPQGEVHDQAEFLNACKEVEEELGRRAGPRHGPRAIDVDLLLLSGVEYRSERLQVPHPRVADRRFVLEPLLELDPALRLPDGTPLAESLGSVEGQRVERSGPL
jgi:2-amino-4-hydroxy-6-hydroxymethyldihydropteridine diphosphokinase